MHITSLDKVKKTVPVMEGAKGILKQIPISLESGTPNFSFRVFTIEPGGHTPLHNHPFEHLNYIIEGSGAVVSGSKETECKKGDFVMIPPGETHQYKNTSGSGALVLICAVPKEYE
ncbi:MAG: cupin domain-containing protein [Chloroflexi bacterium]|nr:cupin domain-containing protein [Chloroflexota bacterium]